MPQSPRVFFAYPHADRSFAERLARSLAQQGLELHAIEPAEAGSGPEEAAERIRSADVVLLLINARSKFDESQQRVWQAILAAAWEKPQLRILPLLLHDAELPPFVRSAASGREVQAIRIQDKGDLGRVTAAIREHLPVKKSTARILAAEAVAYRGPAKSVSIRNPPESVSLEVYPSSSEATLNERRKKLSEMRELVELLWP